MYVIQNADAIARKSDYAHLTAGELIVHGIFPTLQGEGPFVGTRCVFLRLGGCNFGDKNKMCGFCDTDFTLKDSKTLTQNEVTERVNALALEEYGLNVLHEKLLVVTGGEPLLQAENLAGFIHQLVRNYNWTVQIETNGLYIHHLFGVNRLIREVRKRVHIVCSPKAGIHGYGPAPQGHAHVDAYKFVVDHREDSPHHHLPPWIQGTLTPVYISPIAVYARPYKGEVASLWEEGLINKELTEKNYVYAAQLCMATGARLSIQQHLVAGIK